MKNKNKNKKFKHHVVQEQDICINADIGLHREPKKKL